MCLGELPPAMIQELGTPGMYFNSKLLKFANLWLDRRQAWLDGKGMVYIPVYMKCRVGISTASGGCWHYDPCRQGRS